MFHTAKQPLQHKTGNTDMPQHTRSNVWSAEETIYCVAEADFLPSSVYLDVQHSHPCLSHSTVSLLNGSDQVSLRLFSRTFFCLVFMKAINCSLMLGWPDIFVFLKSSFKKLNKSGYTKQCLLHLSDWHMVLHIATCPTQFHQSTLHHHCHVMGFDWWE